MKYLYFNRPLLHSQFSESLTNTLSGLIFVRIIFRGFRGVWPIIHGKISKFVICEI